MSSEEGKVYENRIRRKADRQGLMLTKSRQRDELAVGFGLYGIKDPYNNTLVSAENRISGPYAMTLVECDEWLDEPFHLAT